MDAKRSLDMAEIDRARQIATRAAKEDPRGFAGVADRCGLPRSRVSMFARNRYQVAGNQVSETPTAIKVLAALDGWTCPHTQAHISPPDCRAIALIAAPTHNPMKLSHWRCCQQCPGKPQEA